MTLEKHKNLKEESSFYWREISGGTLKFDRIECEVTHSWATEGRGTHGGKKQDLNGFKRIGREAVIVYIPTLRTLEEFRGGGGGKRQRMWQYQDVKGWKGEVKI